MNMSVAILAQAIRRESQAADAATHPWRWELRESLQCWMAYSVPMCPAKRRVGNAVSYYDADSYYAIQSNPSG